MDASNIESFNAAAMEAVNAMPAPTWHRLRVNNEKIALPGGLEPSSDIEFEIDNIELGESGAFDSALSTFQQKLDARNEGTVDTLRQSKLCNSTLDAVIFKCHMRFFESCNSKQRFDGFDDAEGECC